MYMKKIFKCEKNKVRLDKFLVENLPDFSRSKIQSLIQSDAVKVNHNIVKVKHYWLKEDNVVEVNIISQVKEDEDLSVFDKIKIIQENEDYIILEKPAGVIIHRTEDIDEYSLVDWLKNKYPQIREVGEDKFYRPGIVHRLDKNVSGLMVVALSQEMFLFLKAQFKHRSVRKKYLALVHGVMEDNQGEIDLPIARSHRSGKMVARPKNLEGKDALTLWSVEKQFSHFSLLDVEIKTGRNHQIRAHMQSLDRPIIGDNLYNIKKHKDKFDLDRIFLHAYYLEFTDLNNERQIFKTNLPTELKNIIKDLN